MAPRRERSRTARSEGPRRDVLLWNRRGGGDVSFWFYFVFSSCFFFPREEGLALGEQ